MDFAHIIMIATLVLWLILPSGARAEWERRRERKWRAWLAKESEPVPEPIDWAKYERWAEARLKADLEASLEEYARDASMTENLQHSQGLPAPEDQRWEPIEYAPIAGPRDIWPCQSARGHLFEAAVGAGGEVRCYVCANCGASLTADGRRLAPPSRPFLQGGRTWR
jgi:hypothetical protein